MKNPLHQLKSLRRGFLPIAANLPAWLERRAGGDEPWHPQPRLWLWYVDRRVLVKRAVGFFRCMRILLLCNWLRFVCRLLRLCLLGRIVCLHVCLQTFLSRTGPHAHYTGWPFFHINLSFSDAGASGIIRPKQPRINSQNRL